MNIKGLMVDPITNMPIIILRDRDGQKVLPIWVGVFEANAIALQIENIQTPRPMTHDLLRNIIQDLQATRRQDRRVRPEGEHLLRDDPSEDAGGPGRDRRAAERCDRAGAAHPRADPGRREGHRHAKTVDLSPTRSRTAIGCSSGSSSSTRTTWANTRCSASCPARPQGEPKLSAGRQFPQVAEIARLTAGRQFPGSNCTRRHPAFLDVGAQRFLQCPEPAPSCANDSRYCQSERRRG